jgi:hypothetical protein
MPLDTSIPLSGLQASMGSMNPMQMMGQLLQIRGLQDEQQQRQLQTASLQRGQADDFALRDAIAQNTLPGSGFADYDAAIKQLNQSGHGGAALKLQDTIQDFRAKQETTLKTSLDNSQKKLEIASRIVQGIKEEGTQDAFDRGKTYLTQIVGPDLANQLGDRYDVKRLDEGLAWGRDAGQQLTAQKNMFDQAAKLREMDASDKKDAPVIAEGWKKLGAELFSYAKTDADWQKASDVLNAQGMPASARQMFAETFSPDAVKQATQLLLTPKEQADIANQVATRAETGRHNLVTEGQGQARLDAETAVPSLSDDAIEQAAQRYAMTGAEPSLGMGKQAVAMKAQIANKAAEMYKDLDLPSAMAAYQANKQSLVKMQGQMDQVSAFESKSVKNLQQFIDQAQKTIDTGSPYLNRPVRALSQDLLGSPQMAAFGAARQVMLPEFARINNAGSSLSGVLSDSARQEVENLLKTDATLPQMLAVAKVLVTDAKNSKDSLTDQIRNITARIAKPPKALSGLSGLSGGTSGAGGSGGSAGTGSLGGGPQIGDTVTIGGRKLKITAIHPDGTFDGDPVP